MRTAFILATAAIFVATPALATAPISGLFNTGRTLDNSGVTTGVAFDWHWVPTSYAFSNARRDGNLLSGAWMAQAGTTAGDWLAETADSRWLVPVAGLGNARGSVGRGLYSFTLAFGFADQNFSKARFNGRFAADEQVVSVTLNGTPIEVGAFGGAGAWTNFSSMGGIFAQSNLLSFTVANTRANGAGPGLRVEFLDSSVSAVPEPAVWAGLMTGFAMVGTGMRRRARHAVTRAA